MWVCLDEEDEERERQRETQTDRQTEIDRGREFLRRQDIEQARKQDCC
jgi:Tfp pilus assembly protein PilF